jgi:hypothetical protein
MIARGEYEETVYVAGERCVISIHQRSKTVWLARGDYHGEPIETKGSSSSAAVKAWADAARFRGN